MTIMCNVVVGILWETERNFVLPIFDVCAFKLAGHVSDRQLMIDYYGATNYMFKAFYSILQKLGQCN